MFLSSLHFFSFEEESSYGWGDFMFDAAVVAVPMALALAAMPTGIFTIPVVGWVLVVLSKQGP